jgi:hypothetical protein
MMMKTATAKKSTAKGKAKTMKPKLHVVRKNPKSTDVASPVNPPVRRMITLEDVQKVMKEAEGLVNKGQPNEAAVFYQMVAENKMFPRKALRARQALSALLGHHANEITEASEAEADIDLPETTGETDEQILARINDRFGALERMADATGTGLVKAFIIAGPGGLGKSFAVEQMLKQRKDEDPNFKYDYIKGAITLPGLFISAYRHKEPGQVIVFDDCDSVFADDDLLNVLKAMLDSKKKRTISYRKQAKWMEEEGIEPTFDYEGSVIFLTNKDFDKVIERGGPRAAHFQALRDRCLYLNLTIRSVSDFMVRIKQVVYEKRMLDEFNFTDAEVAEIMDFVSVNRHRFTHLSCRLVLQLAELKLIDPANWKKTAEMTKMQFV